MRGFAPRDLALLIPPELAARVPDDFRGAVIVSGPHGASGSRVNVPSTPFTRYQEGGDGYVLPGGDGPFRPTSPPDLTAECFIGNGIVVAILSTLLITRRDGRFEDTPARVDFSQQAHLVNLQKMFVGRCSVEGIDLTRANHCYPFGGATRCKDGYVSMLLNEEHQWHGLTHIIGRPEWAHDPRFAGGAGRRAMRVEVSAALNAWCSQHTVDEFLALTSQYGVPVGRIRTPAEVLNNPVLRKRGFLSDVETPYGAGVHVGLPYGPIDPLWRAVPYRRAPRLGEHSHAILAGLGHSEADIALYENLALVRRDMA